MSEAGFPSTRDPGPWRRWLDAVFDAPLTVTAPDMSRLVIWIPASLCAGAAAYFMVPSEPPGFAGEAAFALALILVGGAALARGRAAALFALLLTAGALTGLPWRRPALKPARRRRSRSLNGPSP